MRAMARLPPSGGLAAKSLMCSGSAERGLLHRRYRFGRSLSIWLHDPAPTYDGRRWLASNEQVELLSCNAVELQSYKAKERVLRDLYSCQKSLRIIRSPGF